MGSPAWLDELVSPGAFRTSDRLSWPSPLPSSAEVKLEAARFASDPPDCAEIRLAIMSGAKGLAMGVGAGGAEVESVALDAEDAGFWAEVAELEAESADWAETIPELDTAETRFASSRWNQLGPDRLLISMTNPVRCPLRASLDWRLDDRGLAPNRQGTAQEPGRARL